MLYRWSPRLENYIWEADDRIKNKYWMISIEWLGGEKNLWHFAVASLQVTQDVKKTGFHQFLILIDPDCVYLQGLLNSWVFPRDSLYYTCPWIYLISRQYNMYLKTIRINVHRCISVFFSQKDVNYLRNRLMAHTQCESLEVLPQ